MKFKDYFSKTFATSDNHYIQSLKTHYYHARKEDVMNACLEVLKKMKAIVRPLSPPSPASSPFFFQPGFFSSLEIFDVSTWI